MQQTKRRSKKGVILLALAFALLVLAILPASALAAGSITINTVAGPAPVTVGSNLVNVGYMSDNINAAFVSFEVTSAGPGAYGAPSARIAYGPVGTWNFQTISLGSPLLGENFLVRVTFWATATSTTAIDATASGVITYNNSKTVSVLDWNGYGARGDVIPVAPVPPGPPFADYGTTWFGPGWNAAGVAVGPYQTARADFTTAGAAPHSIVYQVDDLYTHDLLMASPAAPVIGNPVPFYGRTTPYYPGGSLASILDYLGYQWDSTIAMRDGFHWVDHYGVATTGLVDGPVARAPFGWDSVRPRWTLNGVTFHATDKIWHGAGNLDWTALASDESGSGVETATVNIGAPVNAVIGTTRLEWTWWQSQAKGTLVPTAAWDALNLGTSVPVSFNATDAVQNVGNVPVGLWFDLTAPHTSHTSVPVDATSFIWNPKWTNTDVKVTFKAMDPGYDDGLGSGVDYTEYVIGSSTSTPPAQSSTGIKGSEVTITDNAPTGPVYLWFRSVDKVGNREVWQKIFVYIDKPTSGAAGSAVTTGPVLTNDVPGWWINAGETPMNNGTKAAVSVPVLFSFSIFFEATDPNSGIGPDLIQWKLPNWNNNAYYADWHQVAPHSKVSGFMVHVNAADDGIYSLESKVKDRAGNETTLSTPLKVDTRAPVTDATAGWVNGLEPYVLHAADQSIGAGVAATIYRVDQSIPWLANVATTVGTTLDTSIPWVNPVQGAVHTVDFGSVDAALPYGYTPNAKPWKGYPSYVFGNLEGTSWIWGAGGYSGFTGFTGYKTRNVTLDVTAPVVTAMDPKNGNWQKGPGVVNFSGTDVGAGYAYTEWSTDGGTTWTKGEVAAVGGDGEITVTYHGVDKVGIKSADQTIVVKVASTPPTVTAKNASVKSGHKATFKFTVTAVTPMASRVIIQIRTKSGRTLSSHSYADVTANAQAMRSFMINLPKGKYNIRISAVDQAGNEQTRRGSATLTVK
jgi:hypothetical protein